MAWTHNEGKQVKKLVDDFNKTTSNPIKFTPSESGKSGSINGTHYSTVADLKNSNHLKK